MSTAFTKFLEPIMSERTFLEERVDHIQQDLSEVKADVKRIDAKLDATNRELALTRVETEKSLGAARAETAALRVDMERGFGQLRAEMMAGFAALRAEIAALASKHSDGRIQLLMWMAGTAISAAMLAVGVAKLFS